MSDRGYFGIGIVAAKTPVNVGTLWRTAHAFGAAWIFTIGHRYPEKYQPTDTSKAARHVPLYNHSDKEAFLDAIPTGCCLIGVEYGNTVKTPHSLYQFQHPDRAVYLLGAEDGGIPKDLQIRCEYMIYIPTAHCLNVAVTGSVVLYDRAVKYTENKQKVSAL